MEKIFMNTENGKTNEPHKFVLNLSHRTSNNISSDDISLD